jgi:hypothetical protein
MLTFGLDIINDSYDLSGFVESALEGQPSWRLWERKGEYNDD